jgi:hypothetical protein
MSEPRFDRDDAPMPSWQGRSAAVSLSLHAAASVAWLIIALLPPAVVIPETSRMVEIARIEVPPPADPPIAIEHPIPPEQLSGYEFSGLPFNLAKIAARRPSLFPFITADLGFLERMAGDLRAASARLANPLEPSLRAQPLELDDRARQHLIDESWSRRDRWQRFKPIASLLVTHDSDDGEAPGLMRAYLDQNLLQPYCPGKTKDGQFWALLENASDHADFLEFIRSYARTHSSTKTTTELLFLMDELAQASQEAATTVIGTSVSKDLAYSAVNSPPSALLAANIGNDLRFWFAARRLSANLDTGRAYNRLRLRVLSTIVATTPNGYRESDARFLAGEILFKESDTAEAIEWWRPMTPVDGDTYAGAARQIKEVIDKEGLLDTFELRRILSTESARWAEINYNRMKQFGYRCDSY